MERFEIHTDKGDRYEVTKKKKNGSVTYTIIPITPTLLPVLIVGLLLVFFFWPVIFKHLTNGKPFSNLVWNTMLIMSAIGTLIGVSLKKQQQIGNNYFFNLAFETITVSLIVWTINGLYIDKTFSFWILLAFALIVFIASLVLALGATIATWLLRKIVHSIIKSKKE